MASTSSSPTSATTTYAISSVTSYTNLGPMPTVLTFPPNCQTDAFDFLGSTAGIGVPWTYYTQGCALSSCCPSSHVYSTPFEWYSKYYSPGVCPYGYATGPVDPIISTASDETVRWCCPTGYTPFTSAVGTTSSAQTTPYYNWFCQAQSFNLSSTAYVVENTANQKIVTTESIGRHYYLAYPFQVRWKSGDFDNIATLTSTSSSKPSSTRSPSSGASAGPSTSGLSTAAIIAIAVVVGIIGLAALSALLWWLRRRSQRRAALAKESGNGYSPAMQDDMYEKDVKTVVEASGDTQFNHELDASQPQVLDGTGPAELAGEPRAELK